MNPSPSVDENKSKSNSISIAAVESSINHLTRTFNRRQRWTEFYNPRKQRSSPETSPWRSRLSGLLDSNAAHLMTILLLAVDLVIGVIELSESEVACQSKGPARERWYHWTGLAILGLLGAKSALQVVALGWSFFRSGGDMVDAAAVAVGLVMEVGLEKFGGGLIVVVSLWRVIRVVESAFELGDGEIEAQIESVLAQFEGIKEMNWGLGRDLEEKNKEIQRLQVELELERTPYVTPMQLRSYPSSPGN